MNYYNLRRATVAVLDRNFEKLANYCARYPAIDEWVKAITYPLSGEEEKDELAVSSALSTFLYDIGGYDIGFSRYRTISIILVCHQYRNNYSQPSQQHDARNTFRLDRG